MRLVFSAAALVILGACAQVPDSAAGVGFDDALVDPRTRPAPQQTTNTISILPEATAISDEALPPAATVAQSPTPTAATTLTQSPVVPTPSTTEQSDQDVILEAAESLRQSGANSGVEPLQASPSNPAPVLVGNPGLSDENDFQAVSSRESIQSDAERLAQASAARQVVEPTALPSRSGDAQPNVVSYALQTSHAPGTRIYTRTGLNLSARAQRNCATYASADQAQIDFLSNGGPRRDRKSLDPDGDGYACNWDPRPYRSAVQN